MANPKMIKLSFDKIFSIWKICYLENPAERVKLDKLDTLITKRMLVNFSEGSQFVQLTQSEILYIKNLYETLI